MAISKSILLLIGVVTTLFSIVSAIPGTASFYYNLPYVSSVCFGNTSQGTLVASSDQLGEEFQCGTLLKVTCTGPVPKPCTGKSVVVKIVHTCPGCGVTMDLSKEAFAIIATPVTVDNIIKIDYVKVS
ncbi:putative EG45-like domain containing protein 1 [Nicotiana sylvestris]|uniref:EG45-like domain containing protein 1 n=1 Tax=Nicotiana sylvestris TaxID=4096 RepID=A0A1U7WSU1_NICSY|nr:PREDICTED: putative EG45-like domain containing protein 1 [Nicotiana sylvestris]